MLIFQRYVGSKEWNASSYSKEFTDSLERGLQCAVLVLRTSWDVTDCAGRFSRHPIAPLSVDDLRSIVVRKTKQEICKKKASTEGNFYSTTSACLDPTTYYNQGDHIFLSVWLTLAAEASKAVDFEERLTITNNKLLQKTSQTKWTKTVVEHRAKINHVQETLLISAPEQCLYSLGNERPSCVQGISTVG